MIYWLQLKFNFWYIFEIKLHNKSMAMYLQSFHWSCFEKNLQWLTYSYCPISEWLLCTKIYPSDSQKNCANILSKVLLYSKYRDVDVSIKILRRNIEKYLHIKVSAEEVMSLKWTKIFFLMCFEVKMLEW